MPATILTFPSNPTVVSAQSGGDPHLTSARVNLIFWGKAWSASPPLALSAQTIASGITSIVNSGYLAELAQYGVIGQPRVVAVDIADGSDPSPDDYVSKLESFIKSRIAAGKVEAPIADSQSFYGVIVAPGVKSTEQPNAGGAHNTFTHGGFTAAKAWIQNDGQLDMPGSPVHIFSHEFAEACATGASCKTADGKAHE